MSHSIRNTVLASRFNQHRCDKVKYRYRGHQHQVARHDVVLCFQAAHHSTNAPMFASREEHNRKQAECFADSADELSKSPEPVLPVSIL